MQKVLTVNTHTNTMGRDENFSETEFPKLNKYLEEGYKVVQVHTVTTAANTSYMYSITFVLEK